MKNTCSLLTKLQRQLKSGRFSFQPSLLKLGISPKEKQQGWLLQKQGPEAKREPGSAAFIWFSSSKQTHFSAEECKAIATGSSPGRGAWAVPFQSTFTIKRKKRHLPMYLHARARSHTCTNSMCMNVFFSVFAKVPNPLHFPLFFFFFS